MRRSVQRVFVAVSVLVMAAGACSVGDPANDGTVMATLRSADGLVDAALTIESDWGAGYRAKVTLTGTGTTPSTSWSVVIAMNGGQMRENDLSTVSPALPASGQVTVRNAAWNAAVSATSTQSFGFNGAGSGRPTIVSVTQSGASANGSTPPPPPPPPPSGTGGSAGAPSTSPPPATGSGTISRQVWSNVSGTAVAAIRLGNAPSSSGTLSSFEAPSNSGDSYGQRVRGFLIPPASGLYTFWVAGDDNSELWLGTDANAGTRRRIAFHTSWTGSREWNKFTTQKSPAIQLTAGTRYYIEALMKEGNGGDNLAVGWARPGQGTTSPSEVIPGSVLSPFSGAEPPPPATTTPPPPPATTSPPPPPPPPSGGTQPPPLTSGCPGYATRFFDCCKPHCGWPSNVPSSVRPMNSCSSDDMRLSSPDIQSSCNGGGAFMCHDLSPFRVSENLAYGYAATSSGDVCGRCYQLQFTGKSFNAGEDPGSAALANKTMIVQAINIGFDVGNGQFDLLVPGGGVGAFNACSAQWGVSNNELGAQFGGFLAACKQQLGFNAGLDAYKTCVKNRCTAVFGSRGLTELQAGCNWFVDWFQAADNPALIYREVACPAQLTGRSGMDRSARNDVSASCR